MRKLIGSVIVSLMVLCLAITAFATAPTFGLTVNNGTLTAGSGTQTVVATVSFTPSADFEITSFAFKLTLDGGSISNSTPVTVSSVDSTQMTAYVPKDGNASEEAEGFLVYMDGSNFETGTIPAGTTVSIPVTLSVDTTNAAVYTLSLSSEDTMFMDGEMEEIYMESAPTATITVQAAAPEPSVNTFTATTTIGNDGYAVPSTLPGGIEKGSAFRLAFTIPEDATSKDAIFAVTAGGVRKYSQRQAGVLNGVDAGSAIEFDVSFLNGTTDGAIESVQISDIGVILSDGAGNFFYTNSDDANNKAPAAE